MKLAIKKISELVAKAEIKQVQADSASGDVINELLLYYKMGNFHNDDLEEEKRYVDALWVFKQAGDGIIIADEYGNNISITDVLIQITEKKHFDYKDLMKCRI